MFSSLTRKVRRALPEGWNRAGHNRSDHLTCQRGGTLRGWIAGLSVGLCAGLLHSSASGAPGPGVSPSGAGGTPRVAVTSATARASAAPVTRVPAPSAPLAGAPTFGATALGTPPSAAGGAAALPQLPLSGDKVLAHIKQTLDWYGQAQGIEQLPQLSADVIARDRLQEAALATVRLAFGFGRAAAAALPSGSARTAPSVPSGPAAQSARPVGGPSSSASSSSSFASSSSVSNPVGSPPGRSLDQVSARVASRVTELESQVAKLDARLARASAGSRAALRAQRDQAAAALALQREVQTTILDLRRFQASMLLSQTSSARDLLGQITDLERSVPEIRQGVAAGESGVHGPGSGTGGSSGSAGSVTPSAPAHGASSGAAGAGAAAPASGAASFRPESAGIIALIGQWIALQSADGQLGSLLKSTDALSKELDDLRTPLVSQARTLVRMDVSGLTSSDRGQLEVSRRALEAAAARFRQLAGLLVPLGDQQFALDSARGALTEWRGSVRSRLGNAARYLLTRLVVLGTLIALVLIISGVWRRAVFKYLHDSRRRSQFQTLRRVAVGTALAVVILFTLVSQIGSLATYVGFLTAGLAVALQNVILSIVAYFFLIGRYGVRVGDRITLAGVTGRVADIGLIRIYLLELAGADLHSTGRIVVLSNSVLFQPQALYKQIPGADYLWHAISLTLVPTADAQTAQQHLEAAADGVYEHYRPAIEAQHAALSRFVDFDTAAPRPEVRVRYAEQGWRFDVRYPVQAEHAARIDQQMLNAVRDLLSGEPKLALAASGEPALEASET